MKIFFGSRISVKGSFAMARGNKKEFTDRGTDDSAIQEGSYLQVLWRSAG